MNLKSNFDGVEWVQRFMETRFEHLAAAIMLLMMVVITLNGSLRYFFGNPLSGVITFTELYLMVGAIFPYFAILQREDGNVAVIILKRKFSNTANNIIALCYLVLMAVIFAYLANTFIQNALELTRKGAVLPGLGYPTYVSWWIAGIGILLLETRILFEIVDVAGKLRRTASWQLWSEDVGTDDWDERDDDELAMGDGTDD